VKLKIYAGEEVRELRRTLGLNQSEFWAHFQVTQSGGSRYESGREIPDSVQVLLNIAFGTDTKAAAIFDEFRQFGRPKKKTRAAAGGST
jgi:transcriptional regulator with XRE-family HTH domain